MATVFLLSLAGIPITAGFFGKYFMIASAITATQGKYLCLIIIAMLGAAVSVYYYFKVIQAMYFKYDASLQIKVAQSTPAFRFGIFILAAITILLGIMPQMLLQYLYF